MSFCLAIFLSLSSFSAYTAELFSNDNFIQVKVSVAQLKQGSIHHTSKGKFLAEAVDFEKDNSVGKKKILLLNAISRIVWSYLSIKEHTLSVAEYIKTPFIRISEPCYIEYCSLKIPL